MNPLEATLATRTDLDHYKAAKRLLFALQLSLGLEDIHSVAATSLTDGPDDKSCDLVYIDRDTGRAIIAQGYEATNTGQLQAPLRKAGSLHQAVNWLLSTQTGSDVPERLQSAHKELHEALEDGKINTVEIWFVHNLPEAKQNETELRSVAQAAYTHIRTQHGQQAVKVVGLELGKDRLLERYEGSQTPILVTDEFRIPVSGAFEESGDNWSALCTSIPAAWLHEQFSHHKENLFSANVRGYLGSTRSQSNINNGIQETARDNPSKFWAYNNGITALVHRAELNEAGNELTIAGLAIVNGAQTTGAIGSATSVPLTESKLLARFITCDDAATVQDIIRYNNRQNPTQASDFRSNDKIQARLVEEFKTLGVIGYNGGRRGGAEDAIRRPGENQISASVAAQALAAFHGRPDVAYHEKSRIWEEDSMYSEVFPDGIITAHHILFVYSLLRAVEKQKSDLGSKSEVERTGDDKDLMRWLSMRGSTFLASASMGAISESLLDKAIPNRYALRFKDNLEIPAAVNLWMPVVATMLALAPSQLTRPLLSAGGLRNRESVKTALDTYRGLIVSTKRINMSIYAAFAEHVTIEPPTPGNAT